MNEQLRTLDHFKASAIDMAVRFGPKVIVAIAILLVGHLLGRWVGRLTERLLRRLKFEAPVRVLLVRAAHLIVFGFFVIMALQNLGVELLPLIAGLGVAGAGVALAMQGILGNVAAGLTIIFTRPFHVGDYLSIGAEEGEVLDVTLFSTTLGHTDRSKVIIPNRKIVGEIMHNYGSIRQLDLSVGVSYGTDIDVAYRLVDAILADNPRVLRDPAPVIAVSQLADFAFAISVKPWVKVPDYVAASGEINRAILEAFRREGVEIPVPQREIRMLGA